MRAAQCEPSLNRLQCRTREPESNRTDRNPVHLECIPQSWPLPYLFCWCGDKGFQDYSALQDNPAATSMQPANNRRPQPYRLPAQRPWPIRNSIRRLWNLLPARVQRISELHPNSSVTDKHCPNYSERSDDRGSIAMPAGSNESLLRSGFLPWRSAQDCSRHWPAYRDSCYEVLLPGQNCPALRLFFVG